MAAACFNCRSSRFPQDRSSPTAKAAGHWHVRRLRTGGRARRITEKSTAVRRGSVRGSLRDLSGQSLPALRRRHGSSSPQRADSLCASMEVSASPARRQAAQWRSSATANQKGQRIGFDIRLDVSSTRTKKEEASRFLEADGAHTSDWPVKNDKSFPIVPANGSASKKAESTTFPTLTELGC